MTLTRQIRHHARADAARQAVIDRRRAAVEERVAPLREPGSRVEARYLTLPVVHGTVTGIGRDATTGVPNEDIIEVERDLTPDDRPWAIRRVTYHKSYIFPETNPQAS